MNRTILSVCVAVAMAFGAGGCSAKPTSAADVNQACQEAVSEWTALYDAFDSAASGKEPDQLAAVKVRDGARKLESRIETACKSNVATEVAVANREMIDVIDVIDACAFVEKCGSKVADQVDKTMAAVDRVRSLVKQ